MEDAKGKSGTERYRFYPCCMYWIVPMAIFISCAADVGFPHRSWGAAYECLDAAGKPVLTNRPGQLHNCRMLSQEGSPNLTPSAAPTPSSQQAEGEGSIDVPPAPNLGAPPSPSMPPPCDHLANPLNQPGISPCIPSNQSGTQPPRAVPTP